MLAWGTNGAMQSYTYLSGASSYTLSLRAAQQAAHVPDPAVSRTALFHRQQACSLTTLSYKRGRTRHSTTRACCAGPSSLSLIPSFPGWAPTPLSFLARVKNVLYWQIARKVVGVQSMFWPGSW